MNNIVVKLLFAIFITNVFVIDYANSGGGFSKCLGCSKQNNDEDEDNNIKPRQLPFHERQKIRRANNREGRKPVSHKEEDIDDKNVLDTFEVGTTGQVAQKNNGERSTVKKIEENRKSAQVVESSKNGDENQKPNPPSIPPLEMDEVISQTSFTDTYSDNLSLEYFFDDLRGLWFYQELGNTTPNRGYIDANNPDSAEEFKEIFGYDNHGVIACSIDASKVYPAPDIPLDKLKADKRSFVKSCVERNLQFMVETQSDRNHDVPYGIHGCIIIGEGRKRYIGTGVLIDNDHVLTAAHNFVSEENNALSERMTFYPAINGHKRPTKGIPIVAVSLLKEYYNRKIVEENQYEYVKKSKDFAVLKLKHKGKVFFSRKINDNNNNQYAMGGLSQLKSLPFIQFSEQEDKTEDSKTLYLEEHLKYFKGPSLINSPIRVIGYVGCPFLVYMFEKTITVEQLEENGILHYRGLVFQDGESGSGIWYLDIKSNEIYLAGIHTHGNEQGKLGYGVFFNEENQSAIKRMIEALKQFT
jgi:V8-like Glu-specific endopeptidase